MGMAQEKDKSILTLRYSCLNDESYMTAYPVSHNVFI